MPRVIDSELRSGLSGPHCTTAHSVSKGQRLACRHGVSRNDLLPLHQEIVPVVLTDTPSTPVLLKPNVHPVIPMRVLARTIPVTVTFHPGIVSGSRSITSYRIIRHNP